MTGTGNSITEAPDRSSPVAEAAQLRGGGPPPAHRPLHVPDVGRRRRARSVELANGFVSRGYAADLVMLRDKTTYADRLSPGVRRVVLDQPRWLRRWPNLVRLLVGVPALARYLRVQRLSDREHRLPERPVGDPRQGHVRKTRSLSRSRGPGRRDPRPARRIRGTTVAPRRGAHLRLATIH